MASVAPRSMPAGLSHRIQSNRLLSSAITRPTPSSVSASLSRVCEAGQQPEIFQPLVADQGLRQLGDTLHHVDEVEHHAAFGAHHQIEVAQADIEIDHHDALPALRKRRTERGRRGGFSNASLARGNDQDLGHT
ncbi:hypothetical protein V1272_006576 [Bradyrhizobium sp. AZCC 1708]